MHERIYEDGAYVRDKRSPTVTWKVIGFDDDTNVYKLFAIGFQNQTTTQRHASILERDTNLKSEEALKKELSQFNQQSVSRKKKPTTRNLKKLTTNKRDERLMSDGKPRYVRCYDNGGKTADRYTIVFTGRYRRTNKDEFLFITLSDNPTHPHGVYLHDSSPDRIDYPSYIHLGKRIAFDALPTYHQQLVINEYKELWRI